MIGRFLSSTALLDVRISLGCLADQRGGHEKNHLGYQAVVMLSGMEASIMPFAQRLQPSHYDRVCVNCGCHTGRGRSVETCPRCHVEDYWASCSLNGVFALPVDAMPCADCGTRGAPLSLRVTTRVVGRVSHATHEHHADYVCQSCAEKRVVKTLARNTLLGWWSFQSLWMAPTAAVRNWYAAIGSPIDAQRWGGFNAPDFARERARSYDEWRSSAGEAQAAQHGAPAGTPPADKTDETDEHEEPPASRFDPLSRLTNDEQLQVVDAPKNAYSLIRAEKTDTVEKMKGSYRRAVKAVHPDLNPDDPKAAERVVVITRAWDVLSDADLRAAYDWVSEQRAKGVNV